MAGEQEKPFEERYETAMAVISGIEEGEIYKAELLRIAHLNVIAVVEGSDLEVGERVDRRLRAAELAGSVAVSREDEVTSREMDEAAGQCKNILELLQTPEEKRPKKPAETSKANTGAAKSS